MKKRSPNLESTAKTKQDSPFRKFWLLVKGQRRSQSQLWSKSTATWSGSIPGFLGRVTHQAAEPRTHPVDVVLTWTRACMANDVACLRVTDMDMMTSSGCSAHGWRVGSPPTRVIDTKNHEACEGTCRAWWCLNHSFRRSADKETDRVARVPRRWSSCQESIAMHGRFSRDNYGTWKGFEWSDF